MTTKTVIKTIPIAQITIDQRLQHRASGLDTENLELCTAAYKGKRSRDKVPPVGVVHEEATDTNWLYDGFHRIPAALAAGLDEIQAEVVEGDFDEADRLALLANNDHGMPPSPADKRAKINRAFDKWGMGLTNGAIQAKVGTRVSTDLVRDVRKEREKAEREAAALLLSQSGSPSSGRASDEVESDEKNGEEERVSGGVKLPAAPAVDPDRTFTDKNGRPMRTGNIGKRNKAPATDAWDIPIQEHAREAFEAIPKFKALLAAIQNAQSLFNELANGAGGVFLRSGEVANLKKVKAEDGTEEEKFTHRGLESAYKQIKAATPTHTVCPWNYVEAPHEEECPNCKGNNWTPMLSRNIPEGAKERAQEEHRSVAAEVE